MYVFRNIQIVDTPDGYVVLLDCRRITVQTLEDLLGDFIAWMKDFR